MGTDSDLLKVSTNGTDNASEHPNGSIDTFISFTIYMLAEMGLGCQIDLPHRVLLTSEL
jgi:hypothetical protein